MGSISNSSSTNNNMAYYNSECNDQYYSHEHITHHSVHDPYYQHNQYNYNTQHNHHHHHQNHHNTTSNKIKNDQILKKFNQFFHNDLSTSSGSAEQISDNLVTVCNGLSYTNLDYHYNEHLFRKHQFDNPCQQYQKHERYHGFYNEHSLDKREHFINDYVDRGHEHAHSKENFIGYEAINEKEHLHSSDHLESVCTSIPLRTPEQYIPTEDHFVPANENNSHQVSNKPSFHNHVSVLHNKLTYQSFGGQTAQDIEDQHKNEDFLDNSSRKTIIKETNSCSKILDKDSSNEKSEEFIQYDRGNFYNETYNTNEAIKPRLKATCDKLSEKEVVNEKVYAGIISPPQEYCHGQGEYNPADYYSDVNIKEEEYDLSNYYNNDYYPHSSHISAQNLHTEHHNGLNNCDDSAINESNNTAGDGSTSSSSKATVPTYKWMQVKRNVPKPQGKNIRISVNLKIL